ncbi:MFS transporter [Moorella sp. E308F]|uniref:MFS transporter n=1 Tax=Moorella sp. E308F TaxID=2572682 RepID=UPI0010FFBE4B|nr:MFS transporter [Moorella sp. E308F]GEA15200.1 MFS transporter [Moorella sp. E308F]
MKRKAWAVMWAVYLAGVAVALNQFKVPPVMQVLMESLQADMATAGWLMSVFCIAGVILALPAAFLLAGLGPKNSGLIGLGCIIIGAVIGAVAKSAAIMLIARTIEGVGLALIAVVAPAVISIWFEPHERGLPMGIWATWVPVGSFLIYNLANPIAKLGGWTSIWWFGAVFALVAFMVYSAIVAPPNKTASGSEEGGGAISISHGLKSINTWLISIAFAAFNFSFIAYATWAPTFLAEVHKMDPGAASFYASLVTLVFIPGGIFAGWVLDRFGNRKGILAASFIICTILVLWAFKVGGNVGILVSYYVILGLAASFVPTCVFTIAPETAINPQFAGVALGVVILGQNSGMFIGPPVVGQAIASGGWDAGVYPLVAGLLVSLVATLLIRTKTE